MKHRGEAVYDGVKKVTDKGMKCLLDKYSRTEQEGETPSH